MARPTRHVPRDSSRRHRWVYLAIAVFVLVDIALIAFALNSARPSATAETARPAPTFGTQATSEPTGTPGPTGAPVAAPVVAVPPTRFLSAVDATTAWRSTTGECPAATAEPELTTDSGVSWTPTNATDQTEITALQSLIASSGSVVEFVGLSGADCAPEFVQTFVGGDTFKSYPDKLETAWFINPADRAVVHSPAGDAPVPCPAVVAVAPRDRESAAVLCADQTVFTTDDAAETWSEALTVPGVVNLAVTPTGYVGSAVGLSECAGVQLIALLADSLEITPTGCLLADMPVETMPGNVAISEADGTTWLWVGDTLHTSTNGGLAWQ